MLLPKEGSCQCMPAAKQSSAVQYSALRMCSLKVKKILQEASYLKHDCWRNIILSQSMVGSRDIVMRNDVWKALDDLCYLYTSKVDTSQPAHDPNAELLAMQLAVLKRPDQQCFQLKGVCVV